MLVAADARRIPLPDESVQCVVTSPPYWGLRKYAGEQELVWTPAERTQADPFICIEEGHLWITERYYTEQTAASETAEAFSQPGAANAARLKNGRWRETNTCRRCGAWRGAYGLEPTVEMYVQHTVEILREIRRVLRPDGVVFWNIGDSYQSGDRGTYMRSRIVSEKSMQYGKHQEPERAPNRFPQLGLKPKDLCLIPERVALAAQADGWYVRSRILWCKPNPMPESVRDRPTDAAEHIWMFTKSERYFWDAEAVREPQAKGTFDRYGKNPVIPPKRKWSEESERGGQSNTNMQEHIEKRDGAMVAILEGGRNLRNVWTFPTQPYKGAHFATFPEELPRRCILAATSARGACRFCGRAWERVTERGEIRVHPAVWSEKGMQHFDADTNERVPISLEDGSTLKHTVDTETIGWKPGCRCRGQHGRTLPCLVLDPFGGSGTTARVATELNRRAVSLDIAYAHPTGYAALADARTHSVQRILPI